MDKCRIIVYDSGIGGLNVLKMLANLKFNADFFYMSDKKNMPYGVKSLKELKSLLDYNLMRIKKGGYDVAVIACNTLYTNFSSYIADKLKIPVFGVQPKIEAKNENALLLSTPRTAESFFVTQKTCSFGLDILPLAGLAEEIENNVFTPAKIRLSKYFGKVKRSYTKLYVACTHYGFIDSELKAIFPLATLDYGYGEIVKGLQKIVTICNHEVNVGINNFLFEDKMRDFFIYQNLRDSK